MMRRTERAVVCLLVVLVCWTPLPAQDRVLALRAARAVAMRRIEERVGSLAVAPKTTVRNLVDESDELRWALQAFLLGLRESSPPQYAQGGVCTVKVQVARAELIAGLRKIQRDYCPKGSRFAAVDFTKIRLAAADGVIRIVGRSRIRPEQREPPLVRRDPESRQIPRDKFGKEVNEYWDKHSTKRGRLMADRAARIDAMRRLAERTKVLVDSPPKVVTVEDSGTGGADLTLGRPRGLREVGVRHHSDAPVVEAEMEAKLDEFFRFVLNWAKIEHKENRKFLRELERKAVKYAGKTIRETGFGHPPEKYLLVVSPEIKATFRLVSDVPLWVCQTLEVIGRYPVDPKDPNRARAGRAALRAAELDARRRLIGKTEALMITSGTSVRDFAAKNEEIPTAMLTVQQGAYVVKGSRKVSQSGAAELTMAIDLKPLWNVVFFYVRKLALTLPRRPDKRATEMESTPGN